MLDEVAWQQKGLWTSCLFRKGSGGDMVMQPPEAKKSSRVSTASTAPSLGSSSARASDVIWLHQH